jgi:hypothetical protein
MNVKPILERFRNAIDCIQGENQIQWLVREDLIAAVNFIESHQWVPMRERAPEKGGTYIVTAMEGKIIHVTSANWQKRSENWQLTGKRTYWKVVAWIPMPEPYRGEADE